MILHSITIENVRAINHLQLTDLPEAGVMVISGDNEAGKSTILDALHTVLHVRHGSGARQIRALQPVGQDVGPRIQVEASVGPYRFRIDKKYLRKKAAELHVLTPRAQRFTGAEAEQRLEEILAEHLDKDLFETLFMRQGPIDAHVRAVGITSLVAALDDGQREEVVDDSAFMRRIETEYARYYTVKTGNPTGELKTAEAQHAEAVATMRQAETELRELEQYVHRHEQATLQLEQTQARQPDAAAELRDAEGKHAAAVDSQKRVDRAQDGCEKARAELSLARAAVTSRERVIETLGAACNNVAVLQANTEELELAAEREKVARGNLTAKLEAARDRAAHAAKALYAARETARLAASAASLSAAEQLANTLEAAEKEVARCRAGLPRRRIQQRDVERVEQAQFQLRTAEIERDAAAATLTLSSVEQTSVEVNGEPVAVAPESREFALSGETVLGIGGVTAVIRAGKEAESAERAVTQAKQALNDLLESLGYSNVQAVRDAKREHDARHAELQDAERALRALQPRDETLTQLRARIERLREQDFAGVPPLAEAEAAVEPARQASERADAAVAKVRAELDAWSESEAHTALQVHLARVADAQDAAARAHQELEAAEASNSSSILRERVAEAERNHAAAMTALKQVQSEKLDVQTAARVLAGARQQIEVLRENELAAEKTIAELTGRITQAAGAAERFERASAATQLAEARLGATRRRAEAVRLLRETLMHHRDLARQKYAQPFIDALTNLAKPIFGNDVGFTLTDELEIQAREVKNTPLNIDALSGGAQEQLAILTRLAIAQLVSNDGVPVIIDDALGSSDPGRLSLMSVLLSELGRSRQVFILTCDQNRFTRVTGAQRYQMSELQNE